jgi:nickel transport protein
MAICITLLWRSAALAHKVYIYAWYDGDMVNTESYFGSKKKVKDGLILVYDPSGNKLLEGRTNDQGEFSFKPPQKTDLQIVAEAGMGHKGEFLLKAEEIGDVPASETSQLKSEGASAPGLVPSPQVPADMEIKAIVEQALDSRLKPVLRELAKIREDKGPGLTEIIGGIGYIFGLMGLVMYIKARNR